MFHFFSLANKQDKTEALDKNAILNHLEIQQFVNDNQALCRVVKIVELYFYYKEVFD